jgi:tetratricopeptide (TPR) repeat protein
MSKNKSSRARVSGELTGQTTRKISFLFDLRYITESGAGRIAESIRKLKKEYTSQAVFLGFSPDTTASDSSLPGFEDLNITIIRQGEIDSFSSKIEDGSACYLFSETKWVLPVNFNDFFREEFLAPRKNEIHYLFFKSQPLRNAKVLGFPGRFQPLLIRALKTRAIPVIENLEWMLKDAGVVRKNIRLDQDFPFGSVARRAFSGRGLIQKIFRWFHWNFKEPIGAIKQGISFSDPRAWRPVFWSLAILSLFILPVISYNAGISGDEEKHHLHAVKVYNYFATDGADTSALSDPKYKLNFYGQSFDLFAYVVIKALGTEKIYETRHVLNGFLGGLIILTSGLFVRMLAGNMAASLLIVFMFFSPRFLGHAMNNPLDIPFALGYIFTLFQTFRFLRKLPDFSIGTAFLMIFGIAFTISIRVGGLILIPYLFMFSGLYLLIMRWPWKFFSKPYLKFVGTGVAYLSLISLSGYFLSLLPWPYALQDPLKNPFEAMKMMANIDVALRVMFEGVIIWSDKLPWYYISKNILLSVPIIILFLFPVMVFRFLKFREKQDRFWIFALYFITIFPLLVIIYQKSNVYGGWRHLLFVYPSLAMLAAMGGAWIIDTFRQRMVRIAALTTLCLFMVPPAVHIIKNYPIQYIYFNKLAGGVKKAYTKYETDYYLASLKPGTDWIIENILKKEKLPDGAKLKIASNAPYDIMNYYFRDYRDLADIPYTRYYDRGMIDWDYAILYNNYIDPFHLKNRVYPPKNTIHHIKVDGVTVCAIVKRENRNDYLGSREVNEGISKQDPQLVYQGIQLLENAIRYDPYNEAAYLVIAQAYILTGQFMEARNKLNTLLSFYPEYDKALNLTGYSYLMEGDATKNMLLIDRAISIFMQAVRVNYKFSLGYHNLGLAYLIKGDEESSIGYLQKALEFNPSSKESYFLIASILERRGNHAQAEEIRQYAAGL